MTLNDIHTEIPLEEIKPLCERWQITEFAVFGSITSSKFTENSDIDILITFANDSKPTLFDMIQMNTEFEAILGRKVDLLTRRSVENSPNYIRKKDILNSMKVVYAS